jgi:hypothetical protein
MARVPPRNPAENLTRNSAAEIHVHYCMGTAGFHVVNLLTYQSNFDNEYFMSEIMQPMVDQLFLQGTASHFTAYGAP